MADGLSEKELRDNISEILKGGDLATLTSKKIREILENKHGVNLKDRKKQIDDIVMSLVDEDSDNSDTSPRSSPSKQVKSSSEPEGSPVKKQKVSVKSERVSVIVPSNKNDSGNKQSSESEEESDGDDDSEDEKPKKTRKASNKRKAAKTPPKEKKKIPKKAAGEKGEGKKKTGFAMPMALSPELAALMGETHMARSDVVKKMWQIIRERNLMDPSDKRYTICDDELAKIVGQKRFMTFSMMKYLKKHVKDPSLMVQ